MGKDAALRGVWIDIVECSKSGGYLRSPKADTPWRSESCAASTLRAIDDVNAAAPRRSVLRRVSSRALIIEAFRACLLSASCDDVAVYLSVRRQRVPVARCLNTQPRRRRR